MSDKTTTIEEAVAAIGDGARVMIGGFGVPGTPFRLLAELRRQGPKRLTLIKNDANETGMGVDHLLANGQVERLIVTHIGLNPRAVRLMHEGTIEVELCAQGILAERIRTAGAGLMGFVTDIGAGTALVEGKPVVDAGGVSGVLETALGADFALLHAARADPSGNLVYAASARNFNPLMAMAADQVIVETEELVAAGTFEPEAVHTAGPFVDRIVALDGLTEEYGVVRRQ